MRTLVAGSSVRSTKLSTRMVSAIVQRLRAWADDVSGIDDDPAVSDLPDRILELSDSDLRSVAEREGVALSDYLSRIFERGGSQHQASALTFFEKISAWRDLDMWSRAAAYWFFYKPGAESRSAISAALAEAETLSGYLTCVTALKQMIASEHAARRKEALWVLGTARRSPNFCAEYFEEVLGPAESPHGDAG